jgi:MFS family permease
MLPEQVGQIVPGGEKNGAWGQVVAIGAMEAMIGPAVFGFWSDRTRSRWGRRRPFIAVGAAMTALALLFMGQAQSLWMMIVGYLLLQISDDVGTGPYAAIIPDVVPEERRGKASGLMSQLQLAAQVVAAGIGLSLKSFMAIYVAIAVINIVCALIVLVTARERATTAPPLKESADAPSKMFDLQDWLAPWKSHDFRWVWLTRFLNAFGFYLITLYVVNYLTDSVKVFKVGPLTFDKPFEAAVIVALCISIAGAIAAVIAGNYADRIGRKRVILIAGWVMFVTLIPFAFVPDFSIIAPLSLVFGMGYGAYLSASWALASDILPSKEDAAKDMGIWQASVSTPQILSGAAGFLVDAGNRSQMGRGYTIAFLLSAFAFLAGSLLVTKVRGSK